MKDGDVTLSSWRDLIKNPKQWWDHRENKLNGLVKAKHPDFKHKDSGLALWLKSAPQWVLAGLEGLEFDVPIGRMKEAKDNKKIDSWKNLLEYPDKWWDNRTNKVNAKSPDFKHKDTGEGLWLDASPAWALSRLPPLKADNNTSTPLKADNNTSTPLKADNNTSPPLKADNIVGTILGRPKIPEDYRTY
ncbi:unnamed protein product [Ilex paraguariensis]|uniref:Uncharacterized protein n=1 Tax=Ilex paraguariensis TaxID=185542 RepID=A0ABC8SP25_9AQUA